MKKAVFSLPVLATVGLAVLSGTLLRELWWPEGVRHQLGAEEEALFAEEDAALFGEEPTSFRHYQLQAIESDAAGRRALIHSEGISRFYGEGDTLEGSGAVISKVMADAVLLNHRGSYGLLWLYGGRDAGEQISLQPLPWPAPWTPETGRPLTLVDLRAQEPVTRLAVDYRQRLYHQPLSLLGAIDVQVDRSPTGERLLRLSRGRDGGAFEALQLAEGDELIGLNGVRMDDFDAFTILYQQLVEMPHVVATLRRENQTVVVMLSLET